jgi:hypothetical protein
MPSYHTFDVKFSHTGNDENGTERVDRRVLTVYGESDLAVQRELEKQERHLKNITVLESTER